MEIVITFEASAALLKKSVENGHFALSLQWNFQKVESYQLLESSKTTAWNIAKIHAHFWKLLPSVHKVKLTRKVFCPKNRNFNTEELLNEDLQLCLIFKVSLLYKPCHEKTCLCQMQTTKAQISLRIHAVWSALCCSLSRRYNTSNFYIWNFKPLSGFCSWAGQFESTLVANPEDMFSHDEAHMSQV